MKKIKQDELYTNLGNFLKTRGIELKEGSYAQNIRTGCGLLTDAINLGQSGLRSAKAKTEKTLDQMRQIIHEKTAPAAPAGPAPAGNPPKAKPSATKAGSGKAKRQAGNQNSKKTEKGTK